MCSGVFCCGQVCYLPCLGFSEKACICIFLFFIILSSLQTAGCCPTPQVPCSLGFCPIPLFGWSQRRLPRLRPLSRSAVTFVKSVLLVTMIGSPRRSFQAAPPTPLRAHLFHTVSEGLQHINPNDSESPPDSFNIQVIGLWLCCSVSWQEAVFTCSFVSPVLFLPNTRSVYNARD